MATKEEYIARMGEPGHDAYGVAIGSIRGADLRLDDEAFRVEVRAILDALDATMAERLRQS